MTDISIAVDIPLMHTIVQASATFIAIIAGFYTAKVLSISSEKQRIGGRLKEVDNEINWRRKTIEKLTEDINDIHNRWAKETVEAFKGFIGIRTSVLEQISTSDDLKHRFEHFLGRKPSENEERIFVEKCPSMLQEMKRSVQERKDSETRMVLPPFQSSAQQYGEVLSNRDEIRKRDNLYETMKAEENRISILNLSKNDLQKEWTYLAFPKNMKFGFSSFIIFAILGVIFPLTYSIWGEYLLSDYNLIYLLDHTDTIAILLFCVGLGLTFIYIGLELRHALGTKNSQK